MTGVQTCALPILQIIRSRPWHNEVKRESKPSKEGRTIWVPKKNPKPLQYPKAKKKGFSTNSLNLSSSDFDDTGTLGSKGESMEKTLDDGDERKKKILRNLGDEEKEENPRPFQYPNTKMKGFSTNSLHILSSDFDDTGTLKSNGEQLEKNLNLNTERKKEEFLQKPEYEEKDDRYPSFRGDPKLIAGPNNAEEATDQPFKDSP